MITITATTPLSKPPAWALLERKLIELMDQSIYPYLAKYTRPDGTLIWKDRYAPYNRDGADDFYESFYNWPLFYLLGGGDHMLTLGQQQWEAVTKQLTDYGLVYKEYERGYDQFHQGESYIYFYFLCLADPTHFLNRERARRFAGLYLGEDPDAPNYDPEKRLIRASHNGSAGPRPYTDAPEPSYGWAAGMRQYGLPFHDVPGINHYDDLKDPALARRMGEAMAQRMGEGDVPTNLMVTSLVTNAFLMTGDEKYRRWVLEYVDAWIERAAANDGLLPDNVGLSGQVGEYMNGRWYGGRYGWAWPHGFYNIGMAAIVAGNNAYLLTQDERYLDLPRRQMERIFDMGEVRDIRDLEMSLDHHWTAQLKATGGDYRTFVAPYRHSDHGWFDYQPFSPIFPTAVWNMSMAEADWQFLEKLRQVESYNWDVVVSYRGKEDAGHEQPWLRYLAGDNPGYPEASLQAAYDQVSRRLTLIREDQADLTQVHIHHWQQLNPVTTEALLQLTTGGPQIIYNGGLLHTRVRYFDQDRRRPGLPLDVAALVEKVEAEQTTINLINLSPFETHNLIIQAGAFGEHQITAVTYDRRTSDYPGEQASYTAPTLEQSQQTEAVADKFLHVQLPPATQVTLTLTMARYTNQPSYELPPL